MIQENTLSVTGAKRRSFLGYVTDVLVLTIAAIGGAVILGILLLPVLLIIGFLLKLVGL